MCGITAIINKSNYNIYYELYISLLNLQHRGQESCGFLTYSFEDDKNYGFKNFGLVSNYFNEVQNLQGNMGIAHVRYPTSGNTTFNEIQPFIIRENHIISLVHNGNLVNKDKLILFLKTKNIYTKSTSDSEIILQLFNLYLNELTKYKKINNFIIKEVVKKIFNICKGSYSVILMINNFGLIAFRDIYGIRPLVYSVSNEDIIISSETIGLVDNKNNYKNINNGELLIINKNLEIDKINLLNNKNIEKNINYLKPCLFEYIYFARVESYINDILVYDFREKIGEKVYNFLPNNIKNEIDIVVPVPQTSLISATKLGYLLNKPLVHAIIKNRYLHRSFINKDSEIIKTIQNINVIKSLVENKNILMVDDSIVRGNTIKHIINKIFECNPKKLYFVSCSPEIKYPNIYGIYIPDNKHLLMANKNIEEAKEELGLNGLYFLTLEKMYETLNELNPKIKNYEDSVFTGNYIKF